MGTNKKKIDEKLSLEEIDLITEALDYYQHEDAYPNKETLWLLQKLTRKMIDIGNQRAKEEGKI